MNVCALPFEAAPGLGRPLRSWTRRLLVAAIAGLALACPASSPRAPGTAAGVDVASQESLAALMAQIQDPRTLGACRAILSGDGADLEPTRDVARSEPGSAPPRICTELEDAGIVAAKDIDIEVPEPCDENYGEVSLACFRSCLEFQNHFAVTYLPDQEVDHWHEDAEFCMETCRIGCDGTP